MTVLSNIITPSNVLTTTNTATVTNKTLTSPTVTGMVVSDGTASGVTYLNGSKVLTSGSALTFDGTKLAVLSSAASALESIKSTSTTSQSVLLQLLNDIDTPLNFGVWGSTAGSFGVLGASTPFLSTNASTLNFANTNASGAILWGIGSSATEQMRLTSTGLGIGTSSPSNKLHVNSGGSAIPAKFQTTSSVSVIQFVDTNTTDGPYLGSSGNALYFGTSSSERARIDSSGNLLVGTTTIGAGNRMKVVGNNVVFTPNTAAYNTHTFSTGAADVGSYAIADTTTTKVFLNAGGDSYFNGGNLLVGTTSAYTTAAVGQIASKSSSAQGFSHFVLGNSTQGYLYVNIADNVSWNAGSSCMYIGRITSTSRSINAAGSINASGADYAEYMEKAGNFTIAKGDVCGIDANGKLTNVFANAISFMVKSTDPAYVGGDVWGNEDALGMQRPTDDSTQEEKDAFYGALETARQKVDRVAFAGQVPVNVTGATSGQYIVAINDNGAIKGQAVSNPTFEQYQSAVGKVIAIESDGRARIIVKVA